MILADVSVWQSCAMTLAAYDISHIVENGKIIEVNNEYMSGIIRHVLFSCMSGQTS